MRLLSLHGVRHVFGLCGDTSLPFYDALVRLDHGIEHILARDERHAAYMADAYAKLTRCVGVCEGPSGGGATYILPGVVEANESSIPLLAITSDIARSSRGRFALTELDQELSSACHQVEHGPRGRCCPTAKGTTGLSRDDDRAHGRCASVTSL